MQPIPVFACALVLAAALAPLPAGAFTMEPVNVSGNGSRVADPDDSYGRLVTPQDNSDRGTSDTKASPSSPFSFNVTRPDQRSSSGADRSAIDNQHLYWNNGSHSR